MALAHDALMVSLADHLAGDNRMVWQNMQLGPAGSPRPDVYAIFRSFAHPSPVAYECKISRSDFLSDVTSGKWMSYLKYASAVVFACEGELIKKSDVPDHCGLIVYRAALIPDQSRWRMAKRPVFNPVTIPQDALLKLLIDGVAREGPRYRAKVWSESLYMEEARKKFGEVLATTVRDRLAVEEEIKSEQYRAQRIIDDAKNAAEHIKSEASAATIDPARRELCEALDLPSSATHWEIRRAVRKITTDAEEPAVQRRHRKLSDTIRRALEDYGYVEDDKEPLSVAKRIP